MSLTHFLVAFVSGFVTSFGLSAWLRSRRPGVRIDSDTDYELRPAEIDPIDQAAIDAAREARDKEQG
jgi:hypothetical protein